MEPRIAKLEAHMEHVRADLGKLADVPSSLAALTERVAHLPAKEFVVKATTTTIALIGALIVFGDKIKVLLGI